MLTEKTCPVINFIRYKFAESGDKDQETDKLVNKIGLETVSGFEGKVSFLLMNNNALQRIVSNTKLVEWSDGSVQLLIGD